MAKGIVLITGVGMKEAKKKFKQPDPADIIDGHTPGKKAKINSPAGAAIELNKKDYIVCMSGDCDHCLEHIGKKFLKGEYHFKEADLLNKSSVKSLIDDIKRLKKEKNLPVHLVHYGGMSGVASKVSLPKETVALSPWEVPSETISSYVEANCASLLNVMQEMKEIFNEQEISKIVIISAISAIRTKRLHTLDAIQKSAIHAMARSMALDLTKEKIYITEIMPGITDTGFYDEEETFKAMQLASEEFGYKYNEDNFPVFKPERVGEAVVFAIDTNAHIRELSLMPYGQYPHLGA
jgi:NADP-dependent 3-hydroxy acid dehydrogenase YdfG